MVNHRLSIFQFYFFGPLMLGLIIIASLGHLWTEILIPTFLAIAIFSFGIFILNYQEKIGKYVAPQWVGITLLGVSTFIIIHQIFSFFF